MMSLPCDEPPCLHATTIISARKGRKVAVAGDGQVSFGHTITKSDAVKTRKLEKLGADQAGVLVGFAGAAADAFALLDRFEVKLKASPGNVTRAAIELAKFWRTDRALRRLQSLLVVADTEKTLMLSGRGDVVEPSDGICAIGSGGSYALAAARALRGHTQFSPEEICREAMMIAGDICIYTNQTISVLTLE